MIDFPTNPAVDTVVTAPSGTSWKWDGTTWVLIASSTTGASGASKPYVDQQDNLRILRAGDTMTGQLNGITPTAAANLARKDYVDGVYTAAINKDWNSAWGLVYATSTGQDWGANTAEVAHLNGAFTATAGRYYNMTIHVPIQCTQSGAQIQTCGYIAGVQLIHHRHTANNYWQIVNVPSRIINLASGSQSCSITLAVVAGGDYCFSGGGSFHATTLYIYDRGPVTRQ